MSKGIGFSLSDRQLAELEARLRLASEREQVRLQTVLMYAQGQSTSQISATLNVSIGAIYRWLHLFQQEGLTGLADRPRSGRPRKADDHYRQVLADLMQNVPGHWTAEQLRQEMARQTGVLICTAYLRQVLRQMGFSYQWAPVEQRAA